MRFRLLKAIRLGVCLWFVAATTSFAAEYRIAHCLEGCPEGAHEDNQLVARSVYALSYNPGRGAADWLAYRMRSGALGIASSLPRTWIEDPDLLAAQRIASQNQLAEELGLIRSRLVPLVSVAGTPYWHEANLLSASTLRTENLDRGAWAGLEWALRNLVNRSGDVYVVTGPIYSPSYGPSYSPSDEPFEGMGEPPIAFFKLVASTSGALSVFRFDQNFGVYLHHCEARTSLEAIEAETGLHFFPESGLSRPGIETLDSQLGCR
jgi:endonuclease G